MLVLGIETSCDETAVGLVEDRLRVRANVIASQSTQTRVRIDRAVCVIFLIPSISPAARLPMYRCRL
jgi:hypothetical protein